MSADNGIHIAEIGGNCPVQADGTIDGVPFYFRARGCHWSVEIGPGNTHLVVEQGDKARAGSYTDEGNERWRIAADIQRAQPCWYHEERYSDGSDPYAAGWMSEDEARAFIAKAADVYRAVVKSVARPSSTGGTET